MRLISTSFVKMRRRQLQDGSDYLTEQVRLYAMTGERNYLDQYF